MPTSDFSIWTLWIKSLVTIIQEMKKWEIQKKKSTSIKDLKQFIELFGGARGVMVIKKIVKIISDWSFITQIYLF